LDNNCDGVVDEDSALDALTWYLDADNDAYGDPDLSVLSCSQPSGYVSDNTDCDDGDSGSTILSNDADCDGAPTNQDCDDNDPTSNWIIDDADCDGVLDSQDCDASDPNSTSTINDADCDGVLDSQDAFPNDPSQSVAWTLCAAFQHGNDQDGFSFLYNNWGSSSLSNGSFGNQCVGMTMNQIYADVYSNSSFLFSIDAIDVGSNPFYIGHNDRYSNGSDYIAIAVRSSFSSNTFFQNDCQNFTNSFSQGSSICVGTGSRYQSMVGKLNSGIYGVEIYMCAQSQMCSTDTSIRLLIYTRYQP
jgi:hypothetical protein